MSRRLTKKEKIQYPYRLRLHDTEHNISHVAWFTQKGAELWDYMTRRGFVGLVWEESSKHGGYYYTISNVKNAMQKMYDEGLIKKGGYFYEENYYIC